MIDTTAPTALGSLAGLAWLVFGLAVTTHAVSLVPGTGLSMRWVWPVPLAAVAAPFAAGLAWVAAYQAARRRAAGPSGPLRRRMLGEFWSARTIGPVVLALVYAVAVAVGTAPTTGDARPLPRGEGYVVVAGGVVRPLTDEEHRAAVAHEVLVLTGASIAWSLWGALALRRLRRVVGCHGTPPARPRPVV